MLFRSFIFFISSIFLLGCSPVDSNKTVSSNAFDELCSKYELHICSDFEPPAYQAPTIEDIKSFSIDLFSGNYIYTKDTELESYDYMSGNPLKGDCDDVVITLLEDLIEAGYVDNGQSKWMFGTVNGETHSWLLLTIDSMTYIFDTYHLFGALYSEVSEEYIEEFIVYRF